MHQYVLRNLFSRPVIRLIQLNTILNIRITTTLGGAQNMFYSVSLCTWKMLFIQNVLDMDYI